jgi:Ca2+-binding EF-hand superfamily protein
MRWLKALLVAVIALAFSTPAMAQDEKKNEKRRDRETPEQAFKKMDADGDGKATKDEVTKWVESNERMARRAKDDPEFVNNMFKRMDGDGDGKVSLDEYKKYRETAGARKKKDPAA